MDGWTISENGRCDVITPIDVASARANLYAIVMGTKLAVAVARDHGCSVADDSRYLAAYSG